MMRAFFIAACVLSLVYIVAAAGIAVEVDSAGWSGPRYYDQYSVYDNYDYYDASAYEDEADEYTRMGGIVSVFYMVISVVAFVLALLRIKTKTMRVVSIIGLSVSGLFFLWSILPLMSPSHVSFDEIAPAFIAAGIALLALDIVGVVHAFRTSS